ncbi:hypothetical protein B296_00018070 [Ensete ventricosum]|uniref:Uncharacterized protein n=1 Tax=Ensete ventricosum TaxID=4639 RepID=A0A426YD63_ENSVE|nr:hypothetical protein B296_00018070 [Ensete ventricosum]
MAQGSSLEEDRDSSKDCQGSPKSLPGKTTGLIVRMSEATGLAGKVEGTTFAKIPTGNPTGKLPVSGGCTATAQAFRRLTHPGWAVEPPVPRNLGTFGG